MKNFLRGIFVVIVLSLCPLFFYSCGVAHADMWESKQPGQIITYCELSKLGDDNYLVEIYTRRGSHVLKMTRKELSKLHRVMY